MVKQAAAVTRCSRFRGGVVRPAAGGDLAASETHREVALLVQGGPGCTNGHTLRIIDWELTALQAHGSRLNDDDLKASITEKFMTMMFLNETDPIIFVGNQADIVRRGAFTVLGVYYPRKLRDTTAPLFWPTS